MCRICQHIWCVPGCPEYAPERDPAVTGQCEICGAILFGVGMKRCYCCEEIEEDDE